MTLMTKPLLPKAIIIGAPNLVKANQTPTLVRHYTMPLDEEFRRNIAFASVQIDQNNKYLKKAFVEDAKGILEYCEVNGIKTIGCTNPKFWQFATKDKQFTANIGKALPGIGDFTGFNIVPLLNHFVLLAKPQAQADLSKGVQTFNTVLKGEYDFDAENLADKVVKHLVTNLAEAKQVLHKLSQSPVVTMDIEGTGLTFGQERVITIAFTDNTKEGWAFPTCKEYSKDYVEMTKLIAVFLKNYKGKHVWHNHLFDIPFIMREVMKIPFTNQKLINKIINNMDIEDTMHIAYLCKNSTARESLSLKDLLFDKYGAYDDGIDQSRLLDYSFEEVGTYNVLDVTGTMEVYNEYYPRMVKEEQEQIFLDYYKVSSKTLMKLKYRGINVDLSATHLAKAELEKLIAKEYAFLATNEHIMDTEYNLAVNAMYKYNSSHVKQKTVEDFDIKFNPNSSAQKAILLFDVIGLPILETTKTGNPATGKDVMSQLLGATKDLGVQALLGCLVRISEAAKISTAFMVAFEELAIPAEDGTFRLHGDFKLTGTVSGRLSAANPNLQQVPSGSTYGDLVQGLFKAPEGMIFWGSDFSSLETHVGAILTKDAALRKVLLEGYDSHSLYTAVYFEEELKERGLPYGPDITAEESFVIAKEAKDLRQQSKSVTFGLQYGATFRSVAKSLGCSNERAEEIVASYHKLHGGVTAYYKRMSDEAEDKGYYLLETGLKLRAPGLQSIDEHIVSSTTRSAENALIQGFGMLTVIAMNKLQQDIEDADLQDKIQIGMNIHDAIYGYCVEDPEIIKWLNDHLIKHMVADFYPDQDIKLKAEMDIGYSWNQHITLSNGCDTEEILEAIAKCKEELDED